MIYQHFRQQLGSITDSLIQLVSEAVTGVTELDP
jgi:hypothetical protein